MPNIFGVIGDNLNAAYGAVDKQLGGLLPGGVEADPAALARDVFKDAAPGRNSTGEGWAAKSNANAQDINEGRLDRVQTRGHAGGLASRGREHVVEEVVERVTKEGAERLAQRGGLYAIPVVGQAAGTYDGITDAFGVYDTVVQVNTGKPYAEHIDDTHQMRRENSGVNQWREPRYLGDSEVRQGKHQNPLWQEAKNRATQFKRNFAPHRGDLGFSEIMGWN